MEKIQFNNSITLEIILHSDKKTQCDQCFFKSGPGCNTRAVMLFERDNQIEACFGDNLHFYKEIKNDE